MKIEEPMIDSERGNSRVLLIGFNFSGQLLEVGVEVFSETHVHVFHGDKASKHNSELFEREFQ